jgi:hypothetical protein
MNPKLDIKASGDLNKSTNQKQGLPVVVMFINGSGRNVQSV